MAMNGEPEIAVRVRVQTFSFCMLPDVRECMLRLKERVQGYDYTQIYSCPPKN